MLEESSHWLDQNYIVGTHFNQFISIKQDALEEGNLQSVLEESSHWLDQNYIVGAQFHEWILQDGYQNLSITELEVLQSLDHNRHEHCYFYIRNNDNMQQLLKKVSGVTGCLGG